MYSSVVVRWDRPAEFEIPALDPERYIIPNGAPKLDPQVATIGVLELTLSMEFKIVRSLHDHGLEPGVVAQGFELVLDELFEFNIDTYSTLSNALSKRE